jgi:hypothetical protein
MTAEPPGEYDGNSCEKRVGQLTVVRSPRKEGRSAPPAVQCGPASVHERKEGGFPRDRSNHRLGGQELRRDLDLGPVAIIRHQHELRFGQPPKGKAISANWTVAARSATVRGFESHVTIAWERGRP